jgi:hypothetical protein
VQDHLTEQIESKLHREFALLAMGYDRINPELIAKSGKELVLVENVDTVV